MSGFFGITSREDCVFDLFFGTDYHSHLGTRRGGLAVYGPGGFDRAIHNIENSPFRTKFDKDVQEMKGNYGIGCISDYEPQPLLIRSKHGSYCICTISKINNYNDLLQGLFDDGYLHFMEMTSGEVNATELVAALINTKDDFVSGMEYALKSVEGCLSILILTKDGIYAARDELGRTPVEIGRNENGFCVSFEDFAYKKLGYSDYRELGPGEIVHLTEDGCKQLRKPQKKKRFCTFLWIYYGYPATTYEGLSVENMRYRCGAAMARRDNVQLDFVAGVPDSGIAHAIGYSNQSGIPFQRPFIKYTPTWPRSFMPTIQSRRNLIARMKLLPVNDLIDGKKMLLIDDSIVRGTQLRETTEFLYECGAKEVHVRPACPPLVYPCKYLNFSRSTSEMDLITRRVIRQLEGDNVSDEVLQEYCDPESERFKTMVEEIRKEQGFTTLQFNRLDDMLDATGLPHCDLCTYCWNGRE